MGIKQLIITSLCLPFGLIFCLQFERVNFVPQLARQSRQVVGGLPCANKNAGMVALPSVQQGIVHNSANFLSASTNVAHLNNLGVSPYTKTTYNALASLYARNLLKIQQNNLPTPLYAPKKNIATMLGTQIQLQSPYSVATRPRSLSPLTLQQTASRINMVIATPPTVPNVRYGYSAIEIPISASLLAAPNSVLYAALNQATPKSAQEDSKEIRLGENGYNFDSLFIKDQKEIKPVNEEIEEDYQQYPDGLEILEESKDKTLYRKRKGKKA